MGMVELRLKILFLQNSTAAADLLTTFAAGNFAFGSYWTALKSAAAGLLFCLASVTVSGLGYYWKKIVFLVKLLLLLMEEFLAPFDDDDDDCLSLNACTSNRLFENA
ncbi:hypothetical protein NC653_039668 [Populus alba x Populus x berolinensis]|uniref:Uncharacterized protein n=1 Tax=Populus alba x Populus x berolinensis TaxID=444605 RepID=A0AAD6LBS2_9ROSI|nr:hypothetical protein NC653_039668 [Populus alba x Populus x berolinensis]